MSLLVSACDTEDQPGRARHPFTLDVRSMLLATMCMHQVGHRSRCCQCTSTVVA
jgi:hypothetical protein